MAEIAGIVLATLPALPAGVKTVQVIQTLLDNYTKAHEFVHELTAECARTQKILAGMQANVGEAHVLFHEQVSHFHNGLEDFLQKLHKYKFEKGTGEDNPGVTRTQLIRSRVRAVIRRQDMMDMRQYILEKSTQVQTGLLYIQLQEQSKRHARRTVPETEPERQEALFEALRCGDDEWAQKLIANRTPTGPYTLGNLTTTPLHIAARYGRNFIIRLLLNRRAVIDARDSSDRTPLMIAVYHKQRQTTEFLIEKRARVDLADAVGATPLHVAVERDGIEAVTRLLARNANVNAADKFGDTPLDAALKREIWPSVDTEPQNNRCAVIRALLTKGAEPARKGESAYNALQRAAALGRVPELKLLAAAAAQKGLLDARTKADPAQNLYATTSLWLAAWGGHEEAVAVLLELGADPSILCKHPEFPTPLWAAYAAGHQNIAKRLLQSGADPNSVNGEEQTILHMAWERDSDKWTELLLIQRPGKGTQRADPRKLDKYGFEPIHYAVCSNRHCVVELLADGGACLDARDETERTPLMMAASDRNPTLIWRLIKLGARLDLADSDGRDAFFRAILAGDLMSAGHLLTNGDDAQLDRPIGTGTTPLQQAIKNRDAEAVRWLLEYGAVLDAASEDVAKEVAKEREINSGQDEILTLISKFRKEDRGTPSRWRVAFVDSAEGEGKGKTVRQESEARRALSVDVTAGRPRIQNSISRESAVSAGGAASSTASSSRPPSFGSIKFGSLHWGAKKEQ